VQDFRKLEVWHLANDLAFEVAQALVPSRCRIVPGLRGQAVRAAGSIADLIAEGCGLPTSRQLIPYVDRASGSASEVRSQLSRALRNGIIDRRTFRRLDALVDVLRAKLYRFGQSVRRRADKEP